MRRVLKWVLWVFVIFLVYAIFNSPAQAAGIVVDAFEGIGAAIAAIGTFFDQILLQSGNSAG